MLMTVLITTSLAAGYEANSSEAIYSTHHTHN